MSRESIPPPPSNLAATAGEGHGEQINSISVRDVAVAELASVLPHAFSRLSPTRAGLLTDQIRDILQSKSEQHLVCIAAASGPPIMSESVIGLAILAPESDTATMLHVDWAKPGSLHRQIGSTVGRDPPVVARSVSESHAVAIWRKLESYFSRANVRFVQWATDPIPTQLSQPKSTSHPHVDGNSLTQTASTEACWPDVMGFTQIGTLEYLSLDVDAAGKWELHEHHVDAADSVLREPPRVVVLPLDPADQNQTTAFERLVERTYVDSLDCPPLSQFRTAAEIIRSYSTVASYSPDLWYAIAAKGDTDGEPIMFGCVVLARHPAPSTHNPEQINPACVIELVYMGIVPEYRGRDYGRAIMETITEICQQEGAERLILAVDQANGPALAAYRRFGMLHLFRETVWGRSVV